MVGAMAQDAARPLISVLLPTIRPHLLPACLQSLWRAAARVPCEVVVVADFAAPRAFPYTWLERPRAGVVDALTAASAVARGDYLFSFNDESTLDPGALDILYDEALKAPNDLLTPTHLPPFGFVYYGLPFAPFPFASRALIERLGGIADPAYGSFYSDPDLSMRAHAQGVPVRVVDGAVIRHANDQAAMGHQENITNYLAADRDVFRARWAHLGELVDP